jgi:hypothetical protein
VHNLCDELGLRCQVDITDRVAHDDLHLLPQAARRIARSRPSENPANRPRTGAEIFGWSILAPAAGTVIYARNDVPTNPRPGEQPDVNSWYLPLPDPVMAYAGNCAIIDHGNSEYSVMMHLQPGSVTVKAGDRVLTGQVVGRLGNSGDAFGPHLHYQLQSGPRLFQDQSLPFRFQNVDPPLFRGKQFDAK